MMLQYYRNMQTLVHLILVYRYWILFPLACFEGPIVAFIIGTLVALGYFNPVAAYFLLVMGDVIPDTAYFLLGKYGERGKLISKYLGKIGISETHVSVIRNLWYKHGGKTMFFSKLAYGMSTMFLISAGFVDLPLSKFFRYALPVTFAQYAILMTLGYYFGASYYQLITSSVQGIGLFIAAAVVIAVGYYFLTRYMRSRLLTEQRKEEEEEAK